jgi:putative CocE/NonD family hydrolase
VRDVTIEYNVPATMRDGTVLRADVYRPTTRGPWPVLLTRHPYSKAAPSLWAKYEPVTLARNGFIVVMQDTRGRFESDGEWEPFTYEEQDGYDTVQWAAELPDSNGSVGMFGGSYLGNTQWMAALSKPPALKAIAPHVTWSDPDDGLFSRGGACELGLALPWALAQGMETQLRRYADDSAALGGALVALVQDLDAVATTGYWELPADRHPAIVRHGLQEMGYERSRRDPEWSATCRVADRHAEIDLPSLNFGGWYDCFSQGTLDNFIGMRAEGRPANLIMGPWPHSGLYSQVGDVNFGLNANGDLLGFRGRFPDIHVQWFRQWLAPDDADTVAPQAELPPVLLYVMGINEWREEQEWPLARAVDTQLFLRSDGRLSHNPPEADEGIDRYLHDPSDPVPTTGGAILMSSEYRMGPLDQVRVEARSDVLVYTSDPLDEDVEVTGRIRAVIHAATGAPTADWVVRLCDVDESGLSLNIVDGITRAVTSPGQFIEHTVDLWSTSHVFRAGHRMRVHVTSSCFPRWDRSLNRAEQQVAHEATRRSHLVLPIVPVKGAGHDFR